MSRLARIFLAAWFAIAFCAAPAWAGSLTLVKQPKGAWIQHSEGYLVSQFLYGAANPGTDNFYLIQWRHTLGDLPPWKAVTCSTGLPPCYRAVHTTGAAVVDYLAEQYVNASGNPTWRLATSAMQMPCNQPDGVTPNEVDAGLHSLNGSYRNYPQSDDNSNALLSTYTALQWSFTARVTDFRIVKPLTCAVNKAGSSATLLFTNSTTTPTQVFYYNLRFRCDPAGCSVPYWSGIAKQISASGQYWQYDDSMSTYGLPNPPIGTTITFNQNIWTQVKALIQSGTGGLDPDLTHWTFSTSSYNEAAWGATSVTTEFSFPTDPLVATTQ